MVLRERIIFSGGIFSGESIEFVEELPGFITDFQDLVELQSCSRHRVVHSFQLDCDYRWSICWSTSGGPSLFFYQKFFLFLLLKEESVGGGLLIHSGPLN